MMAGGCPVSGARSGCFLNPKGGKQGIERRGKGGRGTPCQPPPLLHIPGNLRGRRNPSPPRVETPSRTNLGPAGRPRGRRTHSPLHPLPPTPPWEGWVPDLGKKAAWFRSGVVARGGRSGEDSGPWAPVGAVCSATLPSLPQPPGRWGEDQVSCGSMSQIKTDSHHQQPHP